MGTCYTKLYSGFTSKSPLRKQTDAGAIFVNYDVDTDTFDTAVTAGKLLGETSGGNGFNAVPTMRKTEFDGAKGNIKGDKDIESWEVSLSVNLIEWSSDALSKALAASEITVEDLYEVIKANNYICDDNYIDNITWVGRSSGHANPIIIQIYNALNDTGIAIAQAKSSDTIIPLNFIAHYDMDDVDTVPFQILYPKDEGSITGTVTDAAATVEGATVTVTIDGQDFETTTDSAGAFELYVPYGTGYTATATKLTKTGSVADIDVVAFTATAAGAIAITA